MSQGIGSNSFQIYESELLDHLRFANTKSIKFMFENIMYIKNNIYINEHYAKSCFSWFSYKVHSNEEQTSHIRMNLFAAVYH